jgi:hypothetical protein
MTESAFFTVSHGAFLATRALAREIRAELEHAVDSPDLVSVVIDLSPVDAMTISVADELVGKFLAARASDGGVSYTVLVTGINDETREALSVCLERRDLCVAVDLDGDVSLLAARDHLVETFLLAKDLGTFRAGQVADELGLSASNANNRLKRLSEVGAVRKFRASAVDRVGREFDYAVVAPAPLLAAS